MRRAPIFILGVPRSGTTLLRTILDSHSAIACGPETPWLGGHQPRSVMELWRFLREHEKGYCASYHMPPAVATEAMRGLVQTLMDRYAASKGKSRWAEKTPDNVLYIPFLLELFPEARLLLLTRDGLDVALSTSVVAEHRRGISEFLEQSLGFGPGAPAVQNNPLAALLRWRHWNRLASGALDGREHLRVSYEGLVSDPAGTVRGIMEFIGEPFEAGMLEYAKFGHDYPSWEWGSADVRARGSINGGRVGRAERELSADQLAVLGPLARRGANTAVSEAAVRLAEAWLSGLSVPWGLGRALPEEAWLWVQELSGRDWNGQRVNCPGDGRSPLSWALALLGAEVCFAGSGPEPALARLRDALRVSVSWSPQPTPAALVAPRLAGESAALAARLLAPGAFVAAGIEGSGERLDGVEVKLRACNRAGTVTTIIGERA
jgi:hypothetical protein